MTFSVSISHARRRCGLSAWFPGPLRPPPSGRARSAIRTRLGVAAALARADGEELCVCDLSWVAERSEQLVGHHLRVLRRGGIVSSRREGKMVLYRLTDSGRALLDAVLDPAEVSR